MIKLSASSIKDYINCPARVWYRAIKTESYQQTPEQAFGSAVHKIVEIAPFHDDEKVKIRISNDFGVIDTRKMERCLSNFYFSYSPLLTAEDLVEARFEFILNGVTIVGMMDRVVLKSNLVFDWKTGEKVPESIDSDIQFILYYLAYKNIYGKEPDLFYVSLARNRRVKFEPKALYINNLIDEVIPSIVTALENRNYPKYGMHTGACQWCSYKKECGIE